MPASSLTSPERTANHMVSKFKKAIRQEKSLNTQPRINLRGRVCMQNLVDLDLPYLPVQDPAFAADPMRYVAEARAKHPWLARSDLGYFIHEYAAIHELLGQEDKLRPAYDGIVEQLNAHGTPWGRFTEEQMISLPDDKHRLLRDTFAAKFTPRYANQMRPLMQATIKRLLDEWAPKGSFDFEEFASYFPISNMFALVGAP